VRIAPTSARCSECIHLLPVNFAASPESSVELTEVLLTQVLTPVVLLFLAIWFKPISRTDATLTAMAVGFPLMFVWLAGRWHLFTVKMRPILLLGILVVAVMCWRRSRKVPRYASRGARTWVARTTKIALVLFISIRTIDAIAGRFAGQEPVRLEFPVRDGRFHVGQGGSTPAVNYHTVNLTQRYAVDIVKLTTWGNRASRLRPRDLREYASYGVAVYAPCSGDVKQAESSLPDNLVDGERDRARPAGNQILVHCDGTDVDVLMAHLQAGSVRVKKGEHIAAGDLISAIGNSGNSTEPHLHIHAKRGGGVDTGLEGEGAPMTFDGRFLVRNDSITVPRVR
jgi:hypothetical protein